LNIKSIKWNKAESFINSDLELKSLNCKYCDRDNIIKHGTRKTKNGPVQIYLCRDCNRVFSTNPIPYMNTRSLLILRGISLYNQGYSLGESSKVLEKAFGEKIPRNTLHYWTKNYNDIFTYLNIRKKREKKFPLLPKIYSNKTYSLHRNKVDSIPDEFSTVVDYLYKAYRGFPKQYIDNPPFSEMTIEDANIYKDNMVFEESPTEIRIIKIAEENNVADPMRSILVNDAISICRNLPLYKINSEQGTYFDHVDLVQYFNHKFTLLIYTKDRTID
jgi:transposase-like protein